MVSVDKLTGQAVETGGGSRNTDVRDCPQFPDVENISCIGPVALAKQQVNDVAILFLACC